MLVRFRHHEHTAQCLRDARLARAAPIQNSGLKLSLFIPPEPGIVYIQVDVAKPGIVDIRQQISQQLVLMLQAEQDVLAPRFQKFRLGHFRRKKLGSHTADEGDKPVKARFGIADGREVGRGFSERKNLFQIMPQIAPLMRCHQPGKAARQNFIMFLHVRHFMVVTFAISRFDRIDAKGHPLSYEDVVPGI